ncbi:MAG: hypothetical protein AB1696_19230 [Planctomycetota bacterium]
MKRTVLCVLAVLVCAYLLIGLVHCAIVSYLIAANYDVPFCKFFIHYVCRVWPVVGWPVDLVCIYILGV